MGRIGKRALNPETDNFQLLTQAGTVARHGEPNSPLDVICTYLWAILPGNSVADM
jgi:hypothetical protein